MAGFLITFRESLEAAVVVGLLLSTLSALGARHYFYVVWMGVMAGILLSILFAVIFPMVFGGFTGKTEKLYDGILMFFACGFITHMVFWMKNFGHTLKAQMSKKMKNAIEKQKIWMLVAIALFSVVREGIETVIFFQAIDVQSGGGASIILALLGVVVAVLLSLFLFWTSQKISPKKFLSVSGGVLLFVAAGLLAHGIVEFQGAYPSLVFIKPIFDLSEILSEKEGVGAFLKALFGYDANPSLLAFIAYFLFLGMVFWKRGKA